MEFLKSLSRNLTVVKYLRLLNSGTVNRGRNLCVTVAIWPFDSGWIPWWIATICKKKKYQRKGASTNQLSQRILFGSLEWISLHFCIWLIEIPPIREHSVTRITPRIRLVRGEVWKGTLMVADLEQEDKSRRVRIPQRKSSTRRRWSRPNWGQFPKTADRQSKFIGRDQVLRTPTLTRYPSSRRSSRRPSWRIRPHQHSLYRDQRYPHQNCFEKHLRKLVVNLFNKQTYAVHYRWNQLLSWYRVCRRRLPCQARLVHHLQHHYRRQVQVQHRFQHWLNVRVQTSKHGETRGVTQPIKQCGRKRVSEQKLRIHDKYGETRYLAIFQEIFEDMMRRDADKDCEQVFHVT